MEAQEPKNVDIFIEYINGCKEQTLCEKYRLNLSVVQAMISFGREEHYNTKYWKEYLKPLFKQTNKQKS